MSSRVSTLAIISEVVLWATLLLVAWGGVSWGIAWYNQRFEDGQSITLHFRDASQLTVGSPVHFMGTGIGYVTAVKPDNGRIRVDLKMSPHVLKIPEGSHFTIQFNSLAGAKTLEVLPPRTSADMGSHRYIVDEPIRLRDVMKTQMILAEALESSSNNMAHSLGQVQNERVLMEKLHDINTRLNQYEDQLENKVGMMQGYLIRVHGFKVNSLGYIQGVVAAFQRVDLLTRRAYFKSSAAETVRYFAMGMEKTYQGFVQAKQEQTLQRVERRVAGLDDRLIQMKIKTERVMPRVFQGWACFNTSLCRIDSVLGRWDSGLQNRPLKSNFQKSRKTMENLNRRTRELLENSKL